MRRVWLRASLVIVMLGVAVASGYQVFLTEQHIDDEREAERAFTALAWKLAVSLSDLRAAQQAYVAAGQDRGYWVSKTASQIDATTTSLASLARLSTAPGTAGALSEAASVVDDLKRMDAMARDYSSAGQDLMASDLIFTTNYWINISFFCKKLTVKFINFFLILRYNKNAKTKTGGK